MEELQAALSLMQKICDTTLSLEDLKDLSLEISEKQRIIDTFDSARCTTELERMKKIMQKVDRGETLFQGGKQ